MTNPPNTVIPCGGARAGGGCLRPYGAEDSDEWTSVQGSAYGEASAIGDGQLLANWYSTVLVGDVPGVGRCVMDYEDEPNSTVRIVSLSDDPERFFPAKADQILYYRITIVNENGYPTRELVADRPTRMSAEINSIPPLGVGFTVSEEVIFSDRVSGEAALVLRKGSEGLVLDQPAVPVAFGENRSPRADDAVDITVSVTPSNNDARWWYVKAIGIELSGDRPLIMRDDGTNSLHLSGRKTADGEGMLLVHSFQFEEATHPSGGPSDEGHLALRF
jgi:hypothetical protein